MRGLAVHLKSIFGPHKGRRRSPLPFDLIFKRFRDVLDSNNRALEVITDMTEKLGGDYLFDIIYVKDAYSRLHNSLQKSLRYFDALTDSRYAKLDESFSRIDKQIRLAINDLNPLSGEDVVLYKDITWDMSREVGGKNASLAELRNQMKLDVPEAFAITVRAYDEFMEYNRLTEKIDLFATDSPFAEAALADLRNSILMGSIPPSLALAIENAVGTISEKCGKNCALAVRSSAQDEDGQFSFAGQFETVLNVSPEGKAVAEAYKRVVASLFSTDAMAYQRRLGYAIGKLKMAASCMLMVDAVSSGVIYSADPRGDAETAIINAAWGLGQAIVQGQAAADLFFVKKDSMEIGKKKIAKKDSMIISRREGGSETVQTPGDMSEAPSLTADQIVELTKLAGAIEKHFLSPQDIEWAVDRKGKIFVLQSRPLRLQETGINDSAVPAGAQDSYLIAMKNTGTVVQTGVGAGKVFVIRQPEEIDTFPRGAVLVAKSDSSGFVRLMPYATAIITDIGSPTSHMASLSREFRVPTIVNTGNATEVLRHGQEVTVSAGDDGHIAIYAGIMKDLLKSPSERSSQMEEVFEFRKKRYVLRYVSRLNLIDPLREDFTPEGCRTMHDLLRFIHEKSVAELVENARHSNSVFRKHAAIKLDLPIPTGIMIIDIGGGLSLSGGEKQAVFDQISSIPLRAIIRGMTHPGVWRAEAVSLKARDFLSSMMRMQDITTDSSDFVGNNVAVVSAEYANLSIRFGYHFAMIDCYCSEKPRNNHIYFRFAGGATDISNRTRRVELISAILKEFGFGIKIKGDLIIARLANLRRDEMENVLDQLGRLLAYTRQLDAVLHDESAIGRYTSNFLQGRYEF